MIKYYLTFILSCLFGCTSIPKHEKIANQEMTIFAKKLEKEKQMVLVGSGGSMTENQIKKFALSFWTEKQLNIQEARILFLDTAEKFINQVNENKKIIPFLIDHPIDLNNLDLSITFYEKKLKRLNQNFISNIINTNGRIFYAKWNFAKEFYEDISEESYEEALKLANYQNK